MKLEPLTGKRQSGESNRAVQACNDYIRMGAGRSLLKLHKKYLETTAGKPPSKVLRTLSGWSAKYGWVVRATDYDAEIERQKTELSQEMMRSGVALDHERVSKLKELFELLFGQLFEEGEGGELHNLWLPDVKQIGSGEFAERIDIERYNSPIIGDIRGLLDDLAKETGGRTKQVDVIAAGDITFRVVRDE